MAFQRFPARGKRPETRAQHPGLVVPINRASKRAKLRFGFRLNDENRDNAWNSEENFRRSRFVFPLFPSRCLSRSFSFRFVSLFFYPIELRSWNSLFRIRTANDRYGVAVQSFWKVMEIVFPFFPRNCHSLSLAAWSEKFPTRIEYLLLFEFNFCYDSINCFCFCFLLTDRKSTEVRNAEFECSKILRRCWSIGLDKDGRFIWLRDFLVTR